jgi:hypothetical protein
MLNAERPPQWSNGCNARLLQKNHIFCRQLKINPVENAFTPRQAGESIPVLNYLCPPRFCTPCKGGGKKMPVVTIAYQIIKIK